jgi:BREX system ATP-binding protein BrxC/D
MSKLIEALNRLQSVRTEEGLPSSPSFLNDSRPAEPECVQPHRPDSKPLPKQKIHSEESPRFNLALREWLGILHHEYLGSFVREGGGAVKFAVFPGEDILKTCQQELEGLAKREGYVLAKVDARFTKAHMVERLFQKIAKQIDWDELAYRFVQRLLEEHGHQIPSDRQEFSLRQVAMLNERKEPMLRRDIQTWMEKSIEGDSGMCREFRMAMIRLCMAQLDAGDSDRVLATAVKEWLCGDLRLVTGVKKALIYQKISRHNARYMLSSLTRWLRLTGQGGLILSLDISRYFMKKNGLPTDGSLSFSPSATMDLYELLRQFIDSADEMEGLLMVVLAPQEFLTDSRRGVDRYEALKLRVWDDVRPKHRQNPLASLVRIQDEHEPVPEGANDSSTRTPRRMVPDGEARRVIEGLRAGVPNRHVVTTLGCLQPEVEGRFRRLLEATQQNITTGSCPRGMVIEGEFGSGKSHILEYLQNLALDANFICSRIVISKETPLYHPVRLYYSAIEAAVIPDKRGEVFSEIASQCDVWAPRYKNLVTWVNNPESQIDARFAATLMLYERLSSDMELGHRMTRFWTGDPIGIGDLKKYLQEAGFGERYAFGKISAAELALQRFQFAARLMQAAGYAGWILLIDEAELIGRYSVNQRAKSYAEVARLMNLDGGPTLPGLGAVLALTNDFREEVLEKKGDKVKLLEKLRAKNTEAERMLADKAEKGMGLLESQRIPLGQPPNDIIQEAYQAIRSLHLKGHGWHMWENAANDPAKIVPGTSMRKYVKSWVTHWDSLRFYPGEESEIEASTWKPSCVDQEDLQEEKIPEECPEQSHAGRFASEPESATGEMPEDQEFVAHGIRDASNSSTHPPKSPL